MPLQDMLPGGLDLSNALGTITLVTVPDKPVDAPTFEREWKAQGDLDDKHLPKRNNATDAFRNACRSVETRRASNGSSKLVEIKVDEVLNADAECVYQITRMVRDRDRKVIEHPKAMRLTFDKLGQRTGVNSDPISADLYEHTHEDALRGLENKIRVGYQFNLTTTPGARVRAAVRNTLTDIHATKLRGASGGAYFVKRDRYPVVEALERILAQLYTGDDAAHIDSYAMLNVPKARDQVEKHHVGDMRGEVSDLLANLTVLMQKDGDLNARSVQDVIAKRAELGVRRKEMEELLGRETAAVNALVQMLDDQVETLMSRPTKGKPKAAA